VSLRAARLSLSVQYAVAGDDLPSRNLLRRWAAAALANDAIVTLRFVDTAEGETLNRSYRHKSGPTNVLSFVYDDRPGIVHGDVVLCNHAAVQGQHLNNTVMYTPIYAGSRRETLIGFFAINVHWIEIGGIYLTVERVVPGKPDDPYAGIALCKLAVG